MATADKRGARVEALPANMMNVYAQRGEVVLLLVMELPDTEWKTTPATQVNGAGPSLPVEGGHIETAFRVRYHLSRAGRDTWHLRGCRPGM